MLNAHRSFVKLPGPVGPLRLASPPHFRWPLYACLPSLAAFRLLAEGGTESGWFAMKKTLVIVGAVICLCAVALGVASLVAGPSRLDSRARRQWKDKAISEIAEQTRDPALVLKEIEAMKSQAARHEWDNWISEDLILMTNGDWIARRGASPICSWAAGRTVNGTIRPTTSASR